MAKNSVTKKMVLNALANYFNENSADFGAEVTVDDVLNYVNTALAQLDAKAAKAAEKSAEKKAAGDELRARVEGVLTEELQSIADITIALGDPEITSSMVVSRLTSLCKANLAHKEKMDVNGRKIYGYALNADSVEE